MPFLFDEKLIETLLWFEKQQTGGYGMQMEQYENRKNYVESVKNSFASPGKKTYPEEQEKRPRSFLGLRFVLALFLFLGFLGMRQTDPGTQKRLHSRSKVPSNSLRFWKY